MASITIDGLDEEVFRRNIEAMLRVGEADRAAAKLRALLAPFAGEGRILPARFMEVTAADFMLVGWDRLGESLSRNDLPRHPISALTIAVSDAEAMGLDQGKPGGPGPLIATSHFTDEAYMFSQCGVTDLLDGYSFYGCEWHGSSTHMDTALSLGGVEDLYQAVARLEAALIASPQPALDMIRAGALASCYLAVLLYQSVRDTIRVHGLPRPLCVMAGNEGVYPYFDAPVIGSSECAEQGLVKLAKLTRDGMADGGLAANEQAPAAPVEDLADEITPKEDVAAKADGGFAYERLAGMTMRKSEKKPVLQLAEADFRSAAEMLERAGEERMGDDRLLPHELLAHRGPSHPLFSGEPLQVAPFEFAADEPPVTDEPEAAEPAPMAFESEEQTVGEIEAGEPEVVEIDPFVSRDSFPELAPPAPQCAPALPAAEDALAHPAAEHSGDVPEADQPFGFGLRENPAPKAPRLAAPQASHSLRARFADSVPEPHAPPPPPAWTAPFGAVARLWRRWFG